MCMGLDENTIVPCHAGCILHSTTEDAVQPVDCMIKKSSNTTYQQAISAADALRERDEVGEIVLDEIEPLWQRAQRHGLQNRTLEFND